ncbi:MAG TPA: DinB family protein [Actinomycetota bacterium]
MTEPREPRIMTAEEQERQRRLTDVMWRIRHFAGAASASARTPADPQTGERWDRGQVLAHVAEMLPYWLEQAKLVAASGNGIPFGRVKSDLERVAAIERDRNENPEALLSRMDLEIDEVRAWILCLDESNWAQTGTHQTRGEMSVARIIDEFVLDHLEEHAEQLEQTE